MKLWLLFILFGIFGVFFEVMFTGIKSGFINKDKTLRGYSYIWMFPIYGLAGVIVGPIYSMFGDFNILARGAMYMTLILLVEFITGWMLEKITGRCIWEYNAKLAVKGYIRLDYAPIWFVFGLILERVYLLLAAAL